MAGGTIDEDFRTAESLVLRLSVSATNNLLGTELDRDDVAVLLERVSFTVKAVGEDDLEVQVPSFRVDVTRPCDLMEEVARLSGYNQIPTTFPCVACHGNKPFSCDGPEK